MPFARPTLTGLREQAIEDITTSGVPGLDGLLRNAVLRVLSWCMSGLAYSVYGYLDWIARESVPFTATDEYLQAWAALIGIYPKEATAASGTARFTGIPNTLLPLGAALTRQDGAPYATTADGHVDPSGVLLVPFTATILGAATNCDDGTAIAISDPRTGINSGGMTVGPTTGGSDQETDDELRTRMLAKYAAPPQGGSASDYVLWAMEVPGVTRCWVTPNGQGAGTVLVFPMFDDAQAAHGGFPQGTDGVATDATHLNYPVATGDQLAVADHIWPLQPVTALVFVAAPTPLPVDVTLTGLSPNNADTLAAITASLEDMFLLVAEAGGVLYPSDFYHAILATPGIEHFNMVSPAAPIEPEIGELPVMGTLTAT